MTTPSSAAAITAPLLFVGGGNMANAIIRGGLIAGVLIASRVSVAEPDAAKRAALASMGVATFESALGGLANAPENTAIVLAVKPQSLAVVAQEILYALGSRLVISILAGMPGSVVREKLGGSCRVVRVMPNLPASIGHGATAVARSAGATDADEQLALRLFAAIGPCVERIDESLMDAFTAIAGSGPAYLFYLAEAMTKAATSFGFEPAAAERIVRATLAGSGLLLETSEHNAASLRAAVTSKGGTTAAATGVLEDANAMALLQRAFDAARARGVELGRAMSA